MTPTQDHGRFATTQWTLVLAAGNASASSGSEALAALCRTYWYPVYAFVRRRGHQPDDARDLTQAFFTRLIEKQSLGHADPARGRFRSFLLTAVQNFLANEHARSQAQKRGGGVVVVALDPTDAESRFAAEPAHEQTPEKQFDRRWAVVQLEACLDALRQDYTRREQSALFERLRPFLGGDVPGGSYAAVGAELGMSESAVKVAVHRMRQRYREFLRRQILQTVTSPQEVDDEVRHLFSSLAG